MMDKLLEWLLLLSLFASVPYSYWRIWSCGRIHLGLRLLSFIGIAILGTVLGMLVAIARGVPPGQHGLAILVAFLAHAGLLKYLQAHAHAPRSAPPLHS